MIFVVYSLFIFHCCSSLSAEIKIEFSLILSKFPELLLFIWLKSSKMVFERLKLSESEELVGNLSIWLMIFHCIILI
jgi:hypothetical protein